jgi:hypothetical protein
MSEERAQDNQTPALEHRAGNRIDWTNTLLILILFRIRSFIRLGGYEFEYFLAR